MNQQAMGEYSILNTTTPNLLFKTRELDVNLTSASSAAAGSLTDADKLLIVNLRLYIYGYAVLPLAIIGLILNGFTILVLLHPRMRNFSTNAYLTSLSLANIFCLINFIILYSLRYLLAYDFFKLNVYSTSANNQGFNSYENFISAIYGIIHPIFVTFQLFAIYLTCAVTVDRWIYITFPLKVDVICSMKNTFVAIACIFLFCTVYNLPRWFEIESIRLNTTTGNYYQARMTKFGLHPIFNQIFRRYGYIIFVYGLPFFILLIVNIGIVIKLIDTKKRRRHLLGLNNLISKEMKSTTYSSNIDQNQSVALLDTTQNTIATTNGKGPCELQNSNSNNTANNGNAFNNPNKQRMSMSMKKSRTGANIRASLASSIKLDPKITIMVMAIVLAFFLCQFPYLILNILADSKYAKNKWFHIAKIICDLLITFNCCVNFLIYCFFGQNFREIAKLMLCNPSLKPYHLNSNVLLSRRATLSRVNRTNSVVKHNQTSAVNNNNNTSNSNNSNNGNNAPLKLNGHGNT